MSEHPLIARAIREGRESQGISIRALAKRSGVSPAQINRIQGGEVAKPSMDTLVAIARALDLNPNLLFIVSGHLSPDESRVLLERMFRDGSELVDDWNWRDLDVAGARGLIEDPAASTEALRELALQVLATPETEDTQWQDAYLGTLGGEHDRVLRDLIQEWVYLTPERRQRVADYVHDQAELSRTEGTEEMRKERPEYGRA